MKLGIGIDTGGTYTDAVIYDFEEGKILGSAKALTTRQDLSVGILKAIDALPETLARQAELISLSTTLATNACVEEKSGRAKLIFIGGDRKVIDERGAQYGLPPSAEIYIPELCKKETEKATEAPDRQEVDWKLFTHRLTEDGYAGLDGVGIIEMNSMKNGAVNEKKAKELFQAVSEVPVVCSHELFSERNSLQRGASTLLNAGLFPVIREFLDAVKKALSERGIEGRTLVMVRSDGRLMSEEFASLHPVETLLSGPAASAVGSACLTGEGNCVVVDMGGTTTDIALLKNGTPVTVTDGVSIGRWKTFVDGLYIKTFGLGGDSAVHYEGTQLVLEAYRAVPLCVAASAYPGVLSYLRTLPVRTHTRFLYEHYLLLKDISDHPGYTQEEKAFCRALQDGPLSVTDAAAAVGKEIYTLDVQRLLKDGVIILCGLTPTDIMHIRGEYAQYETRASYLAAQFVAHNLKVSVEQLCEMVEAEVKRRLYVNIVTALLENKYPGYRKNGISPQVEQFIRDSYEVARNGKGDGLLSMGWQTEYTLVGVGAPIRAFLPEVAGMLGTKAVIPEHYEVANALGAVMGSIGAAASIEILPDIEEGFIVYGREGRRSFTELSEATDFARAEAEASAEAEARRRGARGQITVTSSVKVQEPLAQTGSIYLGSVAHAQAVGAVGF